MVATAIFVFHPNISKQYQSTRFQNAFIIKVLYLYKLVADFIVFYRTEVLGLKMPILQGAETFTRLIDCLTLFYRLLCELLIPKLGKKDQLRLVDISSNFLQCDNTMVKPCSDELSQ